MTLTAEQILASHKANIETLFGLTTKAFEGVEKLVELNVTASRAALSEAATHTQAVLGVKDAQELLALQAGLGSSPWLKRPPPTAVTCMTSLRAPAQNSARLLNRKLLMLRRASPTWSTAPPRTLPKEKHA